MLKQRVFNIICGLFVLVVSKKTQTQTLSFQKLMTYYISQDQQLILNDLRAKNFIIEKEKKADTKFFDTQITALKTTQGAITDLTGIALLKNGGRISALTYFTFNNSDFDTKLKGIINRGFALSTEVSKGQMQWYYEKKDTVVTVDKKNLTLDNKKYLRYEITISVFK